jgi:dTDP-4-amino-4,6-dideoxygalactose transaminase
MRVTHLNDMIPFNRPFIAQKQMHYISEAINGPLAGDGPFTQRCHTWLETWSHCHKAFLTHSCTGALEMAALLLNIKPGDEIIMPSYTFPSTANAFALRGGVPVFVDIRQDTFNLDEQLVEAAISQQTRAIVPVHYAGVACEMDTLMAIAQQHRIKIIEDAAQGIMARYKGRALGSMGDLGAYSFHETKNVTCGEGGALLINDPNLINQAQIIRENGTDRHRFLRNEVSHYSWQDLGSSFLPGEPSAAFLLAQLESAQQITQQRLIRWQYYHQQLESLEAREFLRRPIIPKACEHNAHMYSILLSPHIEREAVLAEFKRHGIQAISHYTPLHLSPAGQRYSKTQGLLPNTTLLAARLIRLPLWVDLCEQQQDKVIEILTQALTA